jgi:hypothetical protein
MRSPPLARTICPAERTSTSAGLFIATVRRRPARRPGRARACRRRCDRLGLCLGARARRPLPLDLHYQAAQGIRVRLLELAQEYELEHRFVAASRNSLRVVAATKASLQSSSVNCHSPSSFRPDFYAGSIPARPNQKILQISPLCCLAKLKKSLREYELRTGRSATQPRDGWCRPAA